jgi:hypothetical protein
MWRGLARRRLEYMRAYRLLKKKRDRRPRERAQDGSSGFH